MSVTSINLILTGTTIRQMPLMDGSSTIYGTGIHTKTINTSNIRILEVTIPEPDSENVSIININNDNFTYELYGTELNQSVRVTVTVTYEEITPREEIQLNSEDVEKGAIKKAQILLRRKLDTQWESITDKIPEGEPCFSYNPDTKDYILKIGAKDKDGNLFTWHQLTLLRGRVDDGELT